MIYFKLLQIAIVIIVTIIGTPERYLNPRVSRARCDGLTFLFPSPRENVRAQDVDGGGWGLSAVDGDEWA